MVFYNDIYFNGGNTAVNQIYYDVTQPDGGVAATPVAATKTFSNDTQIPITDGIPR